MGYVEEVLEWDNKNNLNFIFKKNYFCMNSNTLIIN